MPLGADGSTVVRVLPQRRGPARVFLYLTSPTGAVFAAEFEGVAALSSADAAAARLNHVLQGAAPAAARVEVTLSRVYRRLAWAGLGVAGLLIGAGYRSVRARGAAA